MCMDDGQFDEAVKRRLDKLRMKQSSELERLRAEVATTQEANAHLRTENEQVREKANDEAELNAKLMDELASLKEEPKWKVQAEALWSMASVLEAEIKDESKNALFRSGVQVSIAKLKTTAQMLMDFQEDYKWNAETVMEPLPK